jgi:toluene monooxygenase electron transfer component
VSKVTVDGSDQSFICDSEDTLLRGALRAGLQPPYECNSGGCGTCKLQVMEGQTENLYPDAPGLSERDIKKGRILSCQHRCISDNLVVKTRLEDSDPMLVTPTRFKGKLVEKINIAHDLVEFVFESETNINYLAGQFFMLDIPDVGERAYSNSSVLDDGSLLKFVIKRMPGGKGSNHLFSAAEVGNDFRIDGPYGHSYLREDIDRDIVLIAGGSGLSPMLSILRRLNSGSEFSGNIHFFYGAKALVELNENYIHEAASNLGDRFSFMAGLSGTEDEVAGWAGECGFIHEVVDRNFENYPDFEYYMCGPPPMTAATQKHVMLDKKVPMEQIHFDRFY